MISGEKIGQLINQPALINQAEIADINELIKKYPYCTSLYALRLKGLAIANDLDFESELKNTSIHAHDRTHLYDLIHSKGDLKEVTEIALKTTNREETKAKPVSTDWTKETEHTESPSLNEEPTTRESEQEHSVKTSEEEEEVVEDMLNADILTTVIDANFVSSEISENSNLLQDENPKKEERENIKSEIIIPEAEQNEVKPIELAKTPSEPLSEKKELSFSEWLRLKQEGVESNPKNNQEAISNETPATKLIKSETKGDSIDALLDKFIQEEPRISKPVKAFYNPVENAKESLLESDDLVSETLAEIHVLQKNYSKAISAYEKLILLYPEKKTFFASRIEKIREEIKNK